MSSPTPHPKTTAARFGRLRADPQAHLPKWDHPIIQSAPNQQ
jgi:hypothetical protein